MVYSVLALYTVPEEHSGQEDRQVLYTHRASAPLGTGEKMAVNHTKPKLGKPYDWWPG